MYHSFFMDFNERNLASLNQGRYRIQLTEADSGEITFGKMERYHTQLGWIPNDSREFKAASQIEKFMKSYAVYQSDYNK